MNVALILSGGTGSRMGLDTPKQYLKVGGRPLLEYCMLTFAESEYIDALQIVADQAWHDTVGESINRVGLSSKFRGFSKPGANRQQSILNGLEDICRYAEPQAAVIVHDAARPGVSSKLLARSLTALAGHDGVLPVLPMKDTVYCSETGQKVDQLLKRECIYAGQAPETFRLEAYLEANRALLPERILEVNGSTEAAILAGLDVAMIPGEECNYKITTMEDLRRFEGELEQGKRDE